MAINSKTIVSVFLNFLFAVGVILTIVGFIQALQFSAYNIFLSDYPLRTYEDNCDHLSPQVARIAPEFPQPEVSPEDAKLRKKVCESRLVSRRQIKKIEDATKSTGFLIAGFVLVFIFNPKSKFAQSLR